jgi:hypothetical protein
MQVRLADAELLLQCRMMPLSPTIGGELSLNLFYINNASGSEALFIIVNNSFKLTIRYYSTCYGRTWFCFFYYSLSAQSSFATQVNQYRRCHKNG